MKNEGRKSVKCSRPRVWNVWTFGVKSLPKPYCFSLIVCCLAVSFAGGQVQAEESGRISGAAAHSAETLQAGGAAETATLSRSPIARKLLKTWFGNPRRKEDVTTQKELHQLIEQIGSVKLEPKLQTSKTTAVANVEPRREPNEAQSGPEVLKKPAIQGAEPKPEYKPVSSETIRVLKKLSEHPERAANPFELAEVLFLGGSRREAAVFYREALTRYKDGDDNSRGDRAWILFQLGNCLRQEDMPAAKQAYRQLVAQYPDTLVAELAKSAEKLIDWYQQEKPWSLIESAVSGDESKDSGSEQKP